MSEKIKSKFKFINKLKVMIVIFFNLLPKNISLYKLKGENKNKLKKTNNKDMSIISIIFD